VVDSKSPAFSPNLAAGATTLQRGGFSAGGNILCCGKVVMVVMIGRSGWCVGRRRAVFPASLWEALKLPCGRIKSDVVLDGTAVWPEYWAEAGHTVD
jgi:hypothetical protein